MRTFEDADSDAQISTATPAPTKLVARVATSKCYVSNYNVGVFACPKHPEPQQPQTHGVSRSWTTSVAAQPGRRAWLGPQH